MYGDSGFREYLEAKFAIDSESLNRKTQSHFATTLARMKERPVLLDLGTGTAAMIRRIIQADVVPNIVLYGVDSNRDLLEAGRHEVTELLKQKGFSITGGDQVITARTDKREIEVHLVTGDIFDERLQAMLERINFNGATTHAFMDVVPLDPILQLLNRMLPKGGLFYSTINYDGTTEMLPFFEDRKFEEKLLTLYNEAMDEHPSSGSGRGEGIGAPIGKTGGSRTGSALYDRVLHNGFAITGFGSSDWSIFPWNGSYTKDEEIFLNSLILTMYEEGLRHPELDRYVLSTWYAHRSQSIEERTLSLITHQTDILAIKR